MDYAVRKLYYTTRFNNWMVAIMSSRQALARGVAGFGMALLLAACGHDVAPQTAPRAALVVQPQLVQTGIEIFAGEIRAQREPALSFRVGGKIARRLVDAGARVREGQVLAELDSADLRLQAEAAQAQLAAAAAEAALAGAELARYEELLARKLISQSVLDTKQATFEAAQAQAANARAQLAVMQNQSDYARLQAPQDGVIVQRLAEAGQVVAAGQAVFVLAVDGGREVAISIPEARIAAFKLGQPVQVELWSRAGERWPGSVRELSPAADPQARTFAARIEFTAPVPVDLGQSARVYATHADAPRLGVPVSAVGGEAEQAFVWVVDPIHSRATRRAVRVLAWGEREATIDEGLSATDWVVSGGVHLIREGETLRPLDHDNRVVDLKASP